MRGRVKLAQFSTQPAKRIPRADNDGNHSAPTAAVISPYFTVKEYRVEQKNLAKFSYKWSVRADRLRIGSPRLVGGRKAVNSSIQEFLQHSVETLFLAHVIQQIWYYGI